MHMIQLSPDLAVEQANCEQLPRRVRLLVLPSAYLG